jgi:hypothetical protein
VTLHFVSFLCPPEGACGRSGVAATRRSGAPRRRGSGAKRGFAAKGLRGGPDAKRGSAAKGRGGAGEAGLRGVGPLRGAGFVLSVFPFPVLCPSVLAGPPEGARPRSAGGALKSLSKGKISIFLAAAERRGGLLDTSLSQPSC